MPSSAAASANAKRSIDPSDRALQESLHTLLSRLATTSDQIKHWPEASGDDASIHVETTTKLMASIRDVIAQLQAVEKIIQTDQLRKSLDDCLVPMDLLDLLDSNLNPECFARGLLREALGQLAGLKRRKLALELLGAAVQSGLNKRLAKVKAPDEEDASKKRNRDDDDDESYEPPTKKHQAAFDLPSTT
jgi:hypothetical protein